MLSTTQVQSFFFNDAQKVRAVEMPGTGFWFVAADVCRVLGIINNRNAVNRLEDNERHVHHVDTSTGIKKVVIINESGLYSLIFSSDRPQAKMFRRWVTGEVLPALREHGMYVMPGANVAAIAEEYQLSQQVKAMRAERRKLSQNITLKERRLEEIREARYSNLSYYGQLGLGFA